MLTPQLEIYKSLSPLLRDKSVLEVGFLTGFGVLQYATMARKVLAIDIEQEHVDFANWVMPLENVVWEVGDICKGALGMFGAIVMIEVIEHIPRWHEALKVCQEKLLPGGVLIISTPNANGTYLKNELHGDEWTAQEFKDRLGNYFSDVRLYDFSMTNELDTNTRITPLVAVCKNEG
ncbi:MAG: class I SAM-dependent methyltransferase [Candidatus Thorarchaeota archaeon]|jgi:2-polyprenyl-3-methyl-5-hydroxy-6-metoxy-1,4-benzoquinol methylase